MYLYTGEIMYIIYLFLWCVCFVIIWHICVTTGFFFLNVYNKHNNIYFIVYLVSHVLDVFLLFVVIIVKHVYFVKISTKFIIYI